MTRGQMARWPQDGDGVGIFGQRFKALGQAQGAEFQVNSYPTGHQSSAAVASDANRNFVVAWIHSTSGDPHQWQVRARVFSATGVPQSPDFQVNDAQFTGVKGLDIASDPAGDFVVVWGAYQGLNVDVVGRRFAAAGVSQGPLFRVNTYTTSFQDYPSIASDPNGGVAVVWRGVDGDQDGIVGQKFDASFAPLGPEFAVNAHTTGYQADPAIARGANGGFVVAWGKPGGILFSLDCDRVHTVVPCPVAAGTGNRPRPLAPH